MKLTAIFLLAAVLQVSAKSYSQQVTLSLKDVPLEQVFRAIRQQTGYSFMYNDRYLRNTKNVTIQVDQAPLEDVLKQCLEGQPLTYFIDDKIVVIKPRETVKPAGIPAPYGEMRGVVTGDNGPIAGANVVIKRTGRGTSTNVKGEFTLNDIEENDVLQISYIGYASQEIAVKNKNASLFVQLKLSDSKLDEVQVLAYGQTTSRRISTGSISRVTSEDIAKQPVSNVLQAIAGRMPGVLVTQNSGVPGGEIQLQVRGQNQLRGPNDLQVRYFQLLQLPLVIVDGVPYPAAPVPLATGVSSPDNPVIGYGNPLFNLNPSDVESIEVLKDADATALYGSRAANGVILISTKKGRQGKTRVEGKVSHGIATNVRRLNMLSTPEYVALRQEAFKNSGITPTINNAPDLFVWDTTQTSDWQKDQFGGIAHTTAADLSISGGSGGTGFRLSGNYFRHTTIFPGDGGTKKGSMHINVNHMSPNRKLQAAVSIMAGASENIHPSILGPSSYLMPPNLPVYDSLGNFFWYGSYFNPKAVYLATNTNKTQSITGNAQLKYNILQGLYAKISLGYSRIQTAEDMQSPKAALIPSRYTSGYHIYTLSVGQTTTVEPQLEYSVRLFGGTLNALAGGTLQKNRNEQPVSVTTTNYSSDLYLSDLSNAGSVTVSNGGNAYQYASVFGRVGYNLEDKYIVNGSFRRDGSSKFGPNRKWGNFGAIGVAWVFSNERFLKTSNWLSFGKLRGSLGWVGSDNIGNYEFIDTYRARSQPYGGVAGLVPTRLANPNYQWATSEKLEAALELGFLKDRIQLSASWFRNRSGNQLVKYPLSPQAGFDYYTANMNAVVQNTGMELTLTTINIRTSKLNWTTTLNITLPSNKLLSFPGIENTAYTNMVVGKPLSYQRALHFIGVDSTGLPQYEDANKDGKITTNGLAAYGKGDYVYAGKSYPDYHGGIHNSVSWKNIRFDVFLQFSYGLKNYNYIGNLPQPGLIGNVPKNAVDELIALKLDNQFIRATSNNNYYNWANSSDAVLSDASFLRLQNVALSYAVPEKYLKSLKMADARLFLQGQNLHVWHHFKGLDPETGATNIPPLLTIIGGLQFSF